MQATEIDSRLNPDGSIDLRFSTDLNLTEVSIAPVANQSLLAAAFGSAPPGAIFGHDGMRVTKVHGQTVLQFRFGDGNWISLTFAPDDLDIDWDDEGQ